MTLRIKNIKTKCVKQKLEKFDDICKTYDDLQTAGAKSLVMNSNYITIRANVDSVEVDGVKYTSDFLATDKNDDYIVFECIYRKQLDKPKTMKLLDASQRFWEGRGVEWCLIVDAEGGGINE